MPANYAHHRFGQQTFELLPPKARKTVQRFHQLYTIGLHGPDLFFYYNPFMQTSTGSLGRKYHKESGQVFFSQVCQRIREHPTEGAESYLYGLLAHYCLDSVCHPFVNGEAAKGTLGHVEMEVEFDRHLMVLDGIESPETLDTSDYFRLTRGECATVSEFYPPATPANIHAAAWNTRLIVRFLAGKNRKFLKTLLAPFGETIQQQRMHSPANHRCLHMNKDLQALYDEALRRYPVLLEQLMDALQNGTPLGEDFAPDFG